MTVTRPLSPESSLAPDREPRPARLGAGVFFMLVVATVAAFFIAQRLKHTPTAVEKLTVDPAFYPSGGGVPRVEAISFELARAGGVTVAVVKPDGQIVTTLLSDRHLGAHETLPVTWNGRMDGGRGALAPRGEYFVHIGLRGHGAVRSPSSFRLVR